MTFSDNARPTGQASGARTVDQQHNRFRLWTADEVRSLVRLTEIITIKRTEARLGVRA